VAAEGWVCQWDQMPGVVWASSSDRSNSIGVSCRKIEGALPGTSLTSLSRFWKILLRVEEIP
jgi:hypothetical protein